MDSVNPVWEEKPLDVWVAVCVISGEKQRKSSERAEAIASAAICSLSACKGAVVASKEMAPRGRDTIRRGGLCWRKCVTVGGGL